MRRLAPVTLAVLLPACGDAPPAAPTSSMAALPQGASAAEGARPWFHEEAAMRGLVFRHVSGHADRFYFPELMGGGAALFDMDGDGDLDAFCVQSGSLEGDSGAHALFENDGGGRFADVTSERGITPSAYGMGAAVGDYDGDGDADLYVTCVGPNRLFQNDGAGHFTDVTELAGVGDPGWGTSATFLDFDLDGHLDLFCANYIRWTIGTERDCFDPTGEPDYCGPTAYSAPAPDVLYRGTGDGTFEDVSADMGLDQAYGNGLGVVAGDFDDDGLPDLFVANDQTPDNLWLRGAEGRFVDHGERCGVARDPHGGVRAGMGTDAEDVDGDGDLDLIVVHMAREQDGFFRNRGSYFVEETRRAGIGHGTFLRTRFGVGFHDFDADGWLDLFVANGRVNLMMAPLVPESPYDEPNSLLRGTPEGAWVPVEPEGGTAQPLLATSRGAAFGDVDGDGALDILVVNRDGPAHLLMNVCTGGDRSFVARVVQGGRDVLGARVQLRLGERMLTRTVKASYGYCGASDARVHFGLGDSASTGRVRVRWPEGDVEAFGPFEARTSATLVRGDGEAVERAGEWAPAPR